jgi:RNA recognition motif-containing protein
MEDKKRLYVGNLAYSIDDAKLAEIFSEGGAEVTDAKVITDKFNRNRSKGFGFVTMATEEMAEKAVESMNGKEFDGRVMVVNVARPQADRR